MHSSPALHVVGLNSVRPWRHQSRRASAARSSSGRPSGCARRAPGALRVVALHHQLVGAPWRTRKQPRRAAQRRCSRGSSTAGAELIVGGHIHQATVVRAPRVRGASAGGARGVRRRDRARASAARARAAAARRAASSSTAPTSGAQRRDARLARRRLGADGARRSRAAPVARREAAAPTALPPTDPDRHRDGRR